MTKDDTAVFHAFAWNPVKAEYDDWRGMGTPAAIAAHSLELKVPASLPEGMAQGRMAR